MPPWFRKVNRGNCGIPWVNCAVLCVKEDWKGQFWDLRYCLSKLRSLLSFPSGMTSHSKIAQFNWECIGCFTVGMQIAGLAAEIRMPSHPVRQTWHPLFSTSDTKSVNREKSRTRDEFGWRIIEVMLLNVTITDIPNAIRIVLKRARLWLANAGGHLEQ